jgi:hypothetical protein
MDYGRAKGDYFSGLPDGGMGAHDYGVMSGLVSEEMPASMYYHPGFGAAQSIDMYGDHMPHTQQPYMGMNMGHLQPGQLQMAGNPGPASNGGLGPMSAQMGASLSGPMAGMGGSMGTMAGSSLGMQAMQMHPSMHGARAPVCALPGLCALRAVV